jgi:hypothetical protein
MKSQDSYEHFFSSSPDPTQTRAPDDKFQVKLERELKLIDKRVMRLQDKLDATLDIHQGSFTKYFDQIKTSSTAISSKIIKEYRTKRQ